MNNDKIPVRIIYVDFTRDLVNLPIDSINKIMHGIVTKQSITLNDKEVLEIHLISRYSYEKCKRIEIGNKESYNIMYCEKDKI